MQANKRVMEIHLHIVLRENATFEVYDDERDYAAGPSIAEVKQKAIEEMEKKHGKGCHVSFRFPYVEEEYQALYEKAANLMLEKHRGQVDKSGKPYYGHLIRVSQDVFTGKRKIVALLHDIVEDTDVTPEFLLQQGFPQEIVDAVVAISRKEDETYEDFIDRVAQNKLATEVKLSDLEDNMNIFRLQEITEEDRLRLNRYLKAHRKLEELV